MKLYSTQNRENQVDFKTAVFNSMPKDKGLYMPLEIPRLAPEFLENLDRYTFPEIAFEIASALLKDAIPARDLQAIIADAINFDAPLAELNTHQYVLELFHGPSLAFKDFGARFMSRVMAYFLKDGEQLLDVLVATSGDTGGAVALGFLGVPHTRVTILYPAGKVSAIQELQLCSNGANIRAIKINGTFDDCQRLVKQAFADDELQAVLRLTSANSINISRLIPQTFYYFHAMAQLFRKGKRSVVFSVPSGNFGNTGAGLLAWKMGLPVHSFIAATNANDTVPHFLESGEYRSHPAVQTYANAMDVAAPSNWVRIMELFQNDRAEVLKMVSGAAYTDKQTLNAIAELYSRYHYIACPHTAIAWLAMQEVQQKNQHGEEVYVCLSTAHACKFPDVFSKEMAAEIVWPEQVAGMLEKEKSATEMEADFEVFKKYLLQAERG